MTSRAEKDALYALDLSKMTWLAAEGSDPRSRFEIAYLKDGAVAMRQTSDPAGTDLRYTASEWSAFLKGAEAGEFDQDLRAPNQR